jgi:glutathione peroxidase
VKRHPTAHGFALKYTKQFNLKLWSIVPMTNTQQQSFLFQLRRVCLAACAYLFVGSVYAMDCPTLLDHKFNRLQDDAPQNLCQYSGKVTLVINTASYCGYTAQYEGLEKLYAKYKDKGFVVLGFPSNDFSQEPGNNKEIADFCYNTYGVKFPMFAKSSVRGKEMNPLFAALSKASGKSPGWNFHKYLIDKEGKLLANYGSSVSPDDKNLVAAIEKALAVK